MIEYIEELEEIREEAVTKGDGVETLKEGNLAQISANAMCSLKVPNFKTMRIHGNSGKKAFNNLIECGSSHNFLHPEVVKRFGLKTMQITPIKVVVVDKNSLTTTTLCPRFQWRIQVQEFEGDVLVLPVRGCEVVLGVQ